MRFSSSSGPLLSLVTSTSEISHQPVHTYTTYIWQRGRQNRKTGNGRKIQHLHEEREEKKKINPQTVLHWGVQCENRKKTPQHKSTYTIDTTLQQGETYPALASSHPVRCHLFRRRSQTRLTKPGGTKPEALGRGRGVMSVIGEGTRSPTAALFPGLLSSMTLAEAGWCGGARKDKIDLFCLWGEQLHTFTAILSVHSGLRKKQFSLAKPWASSW